MRIKDLTEQHFQKYYETRLAEYRLRKSGVSWKALCPFHKESTPSLDVRLDRGVWKCHGCGKGGGLIDFEKLFTNCDDATAVKNIAELVGEPQMEMSNQPERVYVYHDENGREHFQVVRYPGKKFLQRRRDEKGGWVYKTSDMRMVLYRLPEVIRAANVIVCEGEKDADNVRERLIEAKLFPETAATTSPRGAGKWLESYAPFLTGKRVIVFGDNDDPGRKHAELVAASVFRWANGVKTPVLADVPAHGDVTNFFETRSIHDLIAISKSTNWWRPESAKTGMFICYSDFEKDVPDAIDWMIEGLIQRGSNGLIIARPKGGKSYMVADMAIALASGQNFFGFHVPRRTKVAMCVREDNPDMTGARMRKIRTARKLQKEDLDNWLYLNSKRQTPRLMLEDDGQVAELIGNLKRMESELLILDVMRTVHQADENDNTEMQKIIDILNHIQEQSKCSICLVHHSKKGDDGETLTEMARGAGAIAGYAEWIAGIRVVDQKAWVRQFAAELKSAMAPESFYWKIVDYWGEAEDGNKEFAPVKLEVVQWEPPSNHKTKKKDPDPTIPFAGGDSINQDSDPPF